MKKFRLKGCLWKPGINGLGVRGLHKLPYRKRFDRAAKSHDWRYDNGGTGHTRFIADCIFLECCIQESDNDFQCFFAILYFIVVRLFGWAFFRYDRK